MLARLALLAMFAAVAVGCAPKITGETNAPPPKGGPGGSDRHPPGLTQDEIAEDAKK